MGVSVAKLTDSRIQWMMRRKEEGRMTNNKIAGVYQISTRRLQQLWAATDPPDRWSHSTQADPTGPQPDRFFS